MVWACTKTFYLLMSYASTGEKTKHTSKHNGLKPVIYQIENLARGK